MHAVMAAGAVSLKKPHHIITLRFSEVVDDHANCEFSKKGVSGPIQTEGPECVH